MGLKDERASVIESIFNIVSHLKPKVVMLENVKHLLHHNNGETLQHIVSNLNKIGYNISYNILNAKNFGVPQNRERLIINELEVDKYSAEVTLKYIFSNF